jgi:hypothetical protein
MDYRPATLSDNKRWTNVRNPWGRWTDAQISAGKKLGLPIGNKNEYNYMEFPGANVNVYIIDTDIRITHHQFKTGGWCDLRATNFKGLKSTDMSPNVSETMVSIATVFGYFCF